MNSIITLDNDKGQLLRIAGGKYRILLNGDDTGGAYAVIEMEVPPGGGPRPHAHPEMQEMFYVVEGEIEFRMQGAKFHASKGAFINIPFGGAIHAFKNISEQPAKLVCTVIPAGQEKIFEEMNGCTPEQAKIISEKHGHTVYPVNFLD
jgi:quercetin dioxygenase-like cupin family protein